MIVPLLTAQVTGSISVTFNGQLFPTTVRLTASAARKYHPAVGLTSPGS